MPNDDAAVIDPALDRGDNIPPETPEVPETPETPENPPVENIDEQETPEEKAAREAEEAEAEAKKRIRIPKARFDEAMQKARAREDALNQKIADLQGQLGTKTQVTELSKMQTQVDELMDKYEELILDGKKDEARAIRKQANAIQEQLIDAKTTAKTTAAQRAAIEELKYDSMLASMESQYEALNPDSDSFDQEKTDEVAMLMEAFVGKGFQRPAALEKAVKYVMGAPASRTGEDTAAKRALAARQKAAQANKQQPANASKVGLDTDKGGRAGEVAGIDVMRLTQDKFAGLDEETLAKLRGDEV